MLDRLGSPGLSPGLTRELRKNVAVQRARDRKASRWRLVEGGMHSGCDTAPRTNPAVQGRAILEREIAELLETTEAVPATLLHRGVPSHCQGPASARPGLWATSLALP